MRVALLAILGTAVALYEDQADKLDWCTQHIGKVTHSIFASSGPHRLAIVATELNVVAGVDLRQGSLSWRQVLPAEEKIQLFKQHGKTVLTLSESPNGLFVRLWSMSGALMWDALLLVANDASSPAPSALFTSSAIVVASKSIVAAFHAISGAQLWRSELSDGTNLLSISMLMSRSETELIAYATSTSGQAHKLVAARLSVERGEQLGISSLAKLSRVLASPISVSRSLAAAIDNSNLLLLRAEAQVDTVDLKKQGLADATLLPLPLPSALALRAADGSSAIMKLTTGAQPGVELVRKVAADTSHALTSSLSKEGVTTLALLFPTADGLAMEVVQIQADGGFGEWKAEGALPWDHSLHGPISDAWLQSYSRKDGSIGHRLLLSAQDHSLRLLQSGKDGGQAGWVREEALGAVQQAEIIPLPSLVVAAGSSERPFFGFALPAVVTGVQRRLSAFTSNLSKSPPPRYADTYGTRQVILARTAASKVFGIHSTDGSIIWSFFVQPLEDGDAPPLISSLHVVGHGGSPQVMAIAQGASLWAVIALNPFTGQLISKTVNAGRLLHSTRLPYHLSNGLSPLLLVDTALEAHVFPATAEATAAVSSRCADLFFHILDRQTKQLRGYSIGEVQHEGGTKLLASQVWSIVFPEESTEVTISHFPFDAAVHSPVRVLGDRSVLYKYINRNAVALGVALPGADEEEPSIQVMLVDGASGRVLHSAKHTNCEGKINLLLGENWVIYEYWSKALMQHQISISEFYTNSSYSDDLLSLVLSGPIDYSTRANMFDSYSPRTSELYSLSQSYAFGASVAALGLSHTTNGITPKNILMATSAGQLVIFDKRLLDPRRPHVSSPQKMSTEDKEEGLVPYMPSLGGVNPLAVLSHRHSIKRPHSIVSAPTMLESTSLVLVIGMDLFLSRVAPVREFDRLNEDFNFVALVGATVFLIVATIGSGWFVKRKDLARQWR